MRWRRPDSLFARLIVLQLLVALAMLFVFGALVYVERNVAVARLVAERWAPALRGAAGARDVDAVVRRDLEVRDEPPSQALPAPMATPRMAALRDELERQGIRLQDARIARGRVLWLQLPTADGRARWFGLAEPALWPNVPGRFLLAVLIALLLIVTVSWWFTRRLTRPLEQLRAQMQAQRPGEPMVPATPVGAATPEVAAIGSAYAALLRRFESHERERALLLAGVSHDLRGPLARIRLAADLLPEDPQTEARRDTILRNTRIADRLIESFLDHVRAGELRLDQRADLAAIARGVAAAIARDDLHVIAPESLPIERTHPMLLERMLANLLDNAFRHGSAPVELRIEARGAMAVAEVSDAGAGLPPAARETLLQAFARGDAARSTPGTGLGLAIVGRVVARMGGTIDFEQRAQRHVVRVTLPRGAG